MRLDAMVRALEARRSGSAWMAKCPAHEDRNPSLGIRQEGDKVLVKCYAGCAQRDVIEALKARGLWETVPPTRRWAKQRTPLGPIVAEYNYTDEHGELLYQVTRHFPPKDFRQRYPDGRGGWIWKKHPRQLLYHLPEVLEAPIVFVVEGEKDVETLRAHGFVATTNAGGAQAPWLSQFTAALAGCEVILLPDADAPGRARVLRIARALLGHAAKIIVLEPEPLVQDITAWFEQGHSETYLIAQVEGETVSQ